MSSTSGIVATPTAPPNRPGDPTRAASDHWTQGPVRVGGGVHQVDVLRLGQQGRHTFAPQVVVVGEDHPKRHARDCSDLSDPSGQQLQPVWPAAWKMRSF